MSRSRQGVASYPRGELVGRGVLGLAFWGEIKVLEKGKVFLDLTLYWRNRGSACGGIRKLQFFKVSVFLHSPEVTDLVMSDSLVLELTSPEEVWHKTTPRVNWILVLTS